jgi:hypothetical protein
VKQVFAQLHCSTGSNADGRQKLRLNALLESKPMTANKKRKAADVARADQTRLLHEWKRFHLDELNEALSGIHGTLVAQLMSVLAKMTIRDGKILIEFIDAQQWQDIPASIRLVCLHEINSRLIKLREKHGFAPFDDALPSERPNVFLIVKKLMTGN